MPPLDPSSLVLCFYFAVLAVEGLWALVISSFFFFLFLKSSTSWHVLNKRTLLWIHGRLIRAKWSHHTLLSFLNTAGVSAALWLLVGRERRQEGSDCKKLIMIQFHREILLPWSLNTGRRSYASVDLYDHYMVVIYCVMRVLTVRKKKSEEWTQCVQFNWKV